MDEAEAHKRITSYIKVGDDDQEGKEALERFKKITSYVDGAYDTDDGFQKLDKYIKDTLESKFNSPGNRLFYLALPPSVFSTVGRGLKKNAYAKGTNRIVVEKPFGKDTESYKELSNALKKEWSEEETYRIDHYLGKEMVKNMVVLRFANIALQSSWDKNSISNVQITFKEAIGTEGRGGYFDEFGIIRDILQNRASAAEWCPIAGC